MSWQDLSAHLLDALPQTQCTRCGYPDCQAYAEAIARDGIAINRCPPGGQAGVVRLAEITGRAVIALDPTCGIEAERAVAYVDEAWCIGCTLCIKACPVDAIVGAAKAMHVVQADACNGCELCLPVCPVDCIRMDPVAPGLTGWAAWSADQATESRRRYQHHKDRQPEAARRQAERLAHKAEAKLAHLPDALKHPESAERKRATVEAALAKARARAAARNGS
ncbi:RnfABCDGE type electron transport complex subunit B [Inhella gelatinilytica]|uniref:RnfABCDGE type electron transport complex subunit B n=1 Tax=Inhella gelatinilytica TaxID=2795030 RepID=A0A931IVZ0_9BURK|nr:RnfABCDGE type electron transport complex subunit B [Inhella gelatinilytica]MBH9553807.1 RnfABCDGE type electron transport complex subunit B [Inhella gelatinilytica]